MRLPRMMEQYMPGFSYAACSTDEDPSKAGCARRILGGLLPDTNCYTLEVSFYHCAEAVVMVQPGRGWAGVDGSGLGCLGAGDCLCVAAASAPHLIFLTMLPAEVLAAFSLAMQITL